MRRVPGVAVFLVVTCAVTLPALGATTHVSIFPDRFDPVTVTVTKGDTVTWTAKESEIEPHTVTADDGSFNSDPNGQCQSSHYEGCLIYGQGEQGIKDSYSYRFAKAGTFPYSCKVHNFRGTVVVKKPARTAKPPTSAPQPTTQQTSAPQAAASAAATLSPTPAPTTAAPTITPPPTAMPLAVDETSGSNTGLIAGIVGALAVASGAGVYFYRRRAGP